MNFIMLLCEHCIEAIRSRGEKVVIQDVYYQEYQDEYEDPIKCEWCDEVDDTIYECEVG